MQRAWIIQACERASFTEMILNNFNDSAVLLERINRVPEIEPDCTWNAEEQRWKNLLTIQGVRIKIQRRSLVDHKLFRH